MKNKTKRTLTATLCATIMLSGCGKTEDEPNNETETSKAQSTVQDAQEDNNPEENNNVNSGIMLDIDMDNSLRSFIYGYDSYSKEYKDDKDDYNSKASPIEDFYYDKSESNPGTYSVVYTGEADEVTVPSRINGVLVWDLAGIPKNVKKLTIPDTVEYIRCNNASGVEEVVYNGTILKSSNDIFEKSPFRENATHDGEFIFGNALIEYTGDAEEYQIPEGVVSITDGALKDRKLKLKKVVLPTTLKYIESLQITDTIEEIEVNSQIERIEFRWAGGNPSCLNKINEGVYSLGNVLVYCRPVDDTEDIVIPANINRVVGHCFLGKAHSLKFESEEDVKFEREAFEAVSIDMFEVKELHFPRNTTNLFIDASAFNIKDVEVLTLPESIKYLNGNLIDRCPTYNDPLPETIEIYYCYNDNPPQERYSYPVEPITGLKSQEYSEQALQNGATVVLIAY